MREIGKELQALVLVGGNIPRNAGEHALREELPRAGTRSSSSIRRKPTPRHDAVHVRMMGQRLTPDVQIGREPSLGTEMLGIAGNVLSASASKRMP